MRSALSVSSYLRIEPARRSIPVENASFSAEKAGFLMLSRPIPGYPVFLKYPVWSQRPAIFPAVQMRRFLVHKR